MMDITSSGYDSSLNWAGLFSILSYMISLSFLTGAFLNLIKKRIQKLSDQNSLLDNVISVFQRIFIPWVLIFGIQISGEVPFILIDDPMINAPIIPLMSLFFVLCGLYVIFYKIKKNEKVVKSFLLGFLLEPLKFVFLSFITFSPLVFVAYMGLSDKIQGEFAIIITPIFLWLVTYIFSRKILQKFEHKPFLFLALLSLTFFYGPFVNEEIEKLKYKESSQVVKLQGLENY